MSTLNDPRGNIQSILDWLKDGAGKLHPAVEIVHSDDERGYHLRVRQGSEIKAGDQVVLCPDRLTISVVSMATAGLSWPKEFMSCWSDSLEVLTRFFLMEQFFLLDDSFWYPYIRMLPQPSTDALDTPIYYDPEDCVWIKGTNLAGARKARAEQWHHEYYRGIELLGIYDHARYELLSKKCSAFHMSGIKMARHKTIGPHEENPVALPSSPTKYPVLLPVMDLGNHDPNANVLWRCEDACYVFLANEPIKAGEDVCISYDNKGNEELILGYGFSLFNNPKDSYGLLLKSASTSTSLCKVREMQQELRSRQTEIGNNIYDPAKHSSVQKQNTLAIEDDLKNSATIASANPDLFFLRVVDDVSFFTANQELVDTFSVLVANPRELQFVNVTKDRYWIPPSGSSITHNQVKVASSLLIELQRKHDGITQHDGELPWWPANDRQFHAARYRRSQLQILKTNIQSLTTFLSGANTAGTQLVRLEDVLAKSESSEPNQLRTAIHHILGTRKAVKIRESEDEDLVYTLWLCSSWLLRERLQEKTPFQHKVDSWLDLLRRTYGHPLISEPGTSNANSLPLAVIPYGNEDSYDEGHAIAASYLKVIHRVAKEIPESVFADNRWNTDFLHWAWNIVQQEGVLCPNLTENAEEPGEEFMIFITN
ncbi:hypothetical protein MMC13_005268 [Lambiella insularis]|nr:hypothetical protein [Lambiella insularis]